MYRKRSLKPMIITMSALMIVTLIAIAYSAFTGQLNISGTSTIRKSAWDIHFENLSNVTTTGSAKVLSQPEISGGTTIEDYDVTATGPGDSISFTFKVVNDGNYDAEISSISIGTPTCTGTDTTSNTNVCSKLSYTLTDINGASITVGDDLSAKDSVTMKVTLTYQDFTDPSLLPTEDVSISNLGITINYTQSGSALVKDNGEVADYKVYHQGDKITLNNEDYYVIANSGADKDYVVAFKENPLTLSEVQTYGSEISISTYNQSGYGGITYGGSDNYETSRSKLVLDNWVEATFTNNELKTVDELNVRLITIAEYSSLSSYSWRFSRNYVYWTMTSGGPNGDSVWRIGYDGGSTKGNVGMATHNATLRPVINVYKSALETNNNIE